MDKLSVHVYRNKKIPAVMTGNIQFLCFHRLYQEWVKPVFFFPVQHAEIKNTAVPLQ